MKTAWTTTAVVAITSACSLLMVAGSGCQSRFVDVGTNDAASPPATGAPMPADGAPARSLYGCAELTDPDAIALRAGACGGTCASGPASPYDLATKRDLLAAVAGQWFFCGGALGPDGAIGIEFAPGCRLFFMRRDASGRVARGTEATFQANYDIFDPRPEGSPGRIDIHFDGGRTLSFEVDAFRCPEHLRLRGVGGTIELAPDFDGAGRPDAEAHVRRHRRVGPG